MALRRSEISRNPAAVESWIERSRKRARERAAARRPTPGQPTNSLRLASARKLVEASDLPRPELAVVPPRYSTFREPRGSGFKPASPAQREVVKGRACANCNNERGVAGVDPAHLTPRGGGWGGCDDPLCVIPLCRICHDIFDGRVSSTTLTVDLAPVLALEEWALQRSHMSLHMDHVTALQRLSGCKYAPVGETTLMGAPLQGGPEGTAA